MLTVALCRSLLLSRDPYGFRLVLVVSIFDRNRHGMNVLVETSLMPWSKCDSDDKHRRAGVAKKLPME